MHCPNCANDCADDAKLCSRCGGELGRICHSCGHSGPAHFRFCGHCGAARETAGQSTAGKPAATRSAERRQLTVLYCDLVGSTQLAEQLDPEDLRDVMRLYATLSTGIVARFGGQVAEIVGDGIVCYFGYPQAFEHSAERAIRAGLAIATGVAELQLSSPMAVRIGIATGLMIVGDVIETGGILQHELVGSPVNLAARLQKLAAPGTVTISDATHNLVRGVIACRPLGTQQIAGFAQPLPIFAVIGEDTEASRFKSPVGSSLPPIVDRDAERKKLRTLWRRARRGTGQVVLLAGEPGIGKSRLVRDLEDQVVAERHEFVSHAGLPLHRNTPFHPIARQLRRTAGIEPNAPAKQRQERLEALLSSRAISLDSEALSVLNDSLGPPGGGEDETPRLPQGAERARLLDAVLGLFENLAKARPLGLVFEDVQWFDATTNELLGRLIERVASLPILVILTCRSGSEPAWLRPAAINVIMLGPLAPTDRREVVAGVLRERQLPKDVEETILARTDGVPLFIEELTKAVLESRQTQLAGTASGAGMVPETLRDTLMARLDRQPDTCAVAQLASAIGREFTYELLAMIAPMSPAALHTALDELMHGELIFRHGTPPRATYVFKHALLQELAYESLLRRRRRAIHADIAAALDRHFPDTPPELIGHHYAEAGDTEQALPHFELAGDLARSRSANAEAAAHFGRALQLLQTLPPNHDRDRRELALHIALGAQLTAVRGNAAAEVGAAYDRAMALCHAVGEPQQTFRVLRGLQTFHIVRGDLSAARPIGERLLEEAEQAADGDMLLQAHRPHGLCLLYMGELENARHHLARAAAIYDPSLHAPHRFLYNSDPGVLAHCNLAWTFWLLGFPEQAKSSWRHGAGPGRLADAAPAQPGLRAQLCRLPRPVPP